jgi:malonate decarboxylase alpha subunit
MTILVPVRTFSYGVRRSVRSNRVLCLLAAQHAVDAFIGGTLQINGDANSLTVTIGCLAGFWRRCEYGP